MAIVAVGWEDFATNTKDSVDLFKTRFWVFRSGWDRKSFPRMKSFVYKF